MCKIDSKANDIQTEIRTREKQSAIHASIHIPSHIKNRLRFLFFSPKKVLKVTINRIDHDYIAHRHRGRHGIVISVYFTCRFSANTMSRYNRFHFVFE